MFFLKHFDTILLSFEIIDDPLEGQKCHILQLQPDCRQLFPIGLPPTDEGLMAWLRGRIVPRNREFVNALLAKSGLSHGDTGRRKDDPAQAETVRREQVSDAGQLCAGFFIGFIFDIVSVVAALQSV